MNTDSNKTPGDKPEGTPAAAVENPIRPPRKTELSLRCNYTNPELLEIGKKLAEANRELVQAEDEKKSVTSTLKAKCEGIASRIEQYSGELTSGYTYRKVPCEVRFDTPDKGQKTTIRLDTRQIVSVDAMTLSEMQADLPLEGAGDGATFDGTTGKVSRPKAAAVDGETGCVVTPGDKEDSDNE